MFAIAVVLSAITIVGTGLLVAFPQPWALLLSHSSNVVLAAFFCVTILFYVLGSGRVTSDKIFAAICVYMLLGYGWTFVYSLLLEVQPQSFAAASEVARNDYAGRILQLLYFGFMTPTTVGYATSFLTHRRRESWQFLKRSWGSFTSWL